MRTFSMPTPHVASQLASVILRVWSVAYRGDWVGSVALDLLCGRAYSFGRQDRSSWAAVSCPLAIERVQSQTELLRWLWLKRSESFQDMMRRMNNWLPQLRTRSQLKHILRCTHAKIVDSYAPHCQLSRVTFHVSSIAEWQQAVS